MALTRFRRTLKYARPEVRALTHTLHLPPALSEIYDGPRPGWLRDILEYLPCLQCLMVSRLPFFDHNAMVALRELPRSTEYNVRLLLADHEPNTTSAGLAETILRFPRLIYLDLSYTTSARDQSVLSALSQLENLQILKLRGIGLRDADAQFLANAIGTRTRFLDVRNNLLTDMAVRSLLQASFTPANRAPQTNYQSRQLEYLQSPDLDEQYLKLLAQPGSSQSWIEDLPYAGITHLYIANNPITVEGVASLLASSRLHALDVGTVNTADVVLGITPDMRHIPEPRSSCPYWAISPEKSLLIFGLIMLLLPQSPRRKTPHRKGNISQSFLPAVRYDEKLNWTHHRKFMSYQEKGFPSLSLQTRQYPILKV